MVIMIITSDFGTNRRQANKNKRSHKKRANVFLFLYITVSSNHSILPDVTSDRYNRQAFEVGMNKLK